MDYSTFKSEINETLKNIDLYKVLGINKNATHTDIKRAYHKKALKLHPDKLISKIKEKELEEEMYLLNAVYNVLSDPIKRRNYDGEYSADFSELSSPYKIIQNLEKDYKEGLINKSEYNKKWREAMPKEHDAVYELRSEFKDISQNNFSSKFNQIFSENRKADPNDVGYGDYGKELAPRTSKKVGTSYSSAVKLSNIEKPNNVFKKFDNEEFNYIFDKFKNGNQEEELPTEIEGFEANDLNYSAPIHNYNGLIIVGDDPDNFSSKYQLTELRSESLQYTDYSDAFDSHKNPESIYIDSKKMKKYLKKKRKETEAITKKEALNKINNYKNIPDLKPMETEEEYFNRKKQTIQKEKHYSQNFVEHFISQYPEHLISSAKQGLLECSNEKSDTGMFFGS